MHWIFKNKDQGKTAATASLGLVTLWDVEGGLPQIDKFLYSKDNFVVAGLAQASPCKAPRDAFKWTVQHAQLCLSH